jgi:hypothetical protein
VGGFVEVVEGEELVGVGDAKMGLTVVQVGGGEVGEEGNGRLVQPFAFEDGPFFKGVAVAQGETGEKVALVEGGGGGGGGRVWGQAAEGAGVYLVGLGGIKADGGAVGEEVGGDVLAQVGELFAQVGGGLLGVAVGPEELGQVFAGVRPLVVGQVDQQGFGFA